LNYTRSNPHFTAKGSGSCVSYHNGPTQKISVTEQNLHTGTYGEFVGARHLPNMEQPAAFNEMLVKWLNAHI